MKDFLAGIKQAQNRTTYYAPNQLAQMRPNPRWQQQGGRGQGERERLYDPRIYDAQTVRSFVLFSLFFASFSGALRGFPRDTEFTAAAGTPRQPETDDS